MEFRTKTLIFIATQVQIFLLVEVEVQLVNIILMMNLITPHTEPAMHPIRIATHIQKL